MKKFLIFFIFIFQISVATEKEYDDISTFEYKISAEAEPLTLVASCVNVESGRFFQVEEDFVGNTIDPIHLVRCYDSGSCAESFLGLGTGLQFSLFVSDKQEGSKHSYTAISLRDGCLIPFRKGGDDYDYRIDPRVIKKHYTNVSRSEISAKNNLINYSANFKKDKDQWEVLSGDGSLKRYSLFNHKLSNSKRREMGLPTKYVYVLKEEVKPNGNKLTFEYGILDEKPVLTKISTLNRANGCINSLNLDYSPAHAACVAISSCKNVVSYLHPYQKCSYEDFLSNYTEGNRKVLLSSNSTQTGKTDYLIENGLGHLPRIQGVIKSEKLLMQIQYYQEPEQRVHLLLEPLSDNGQLIPTHHFEYDKNFTRVLDGLRQATEYHFDSTRRLSQIKYFDNGHIAKEHVFEWYTEQGKEGWLKSKSVQNGSNIYLLHKYDYDPKGNVIKKIVYGNITGTKPKHFDIQNKFLMDAYYVDHVYSNDGFNLLKEKIYPQGLKITYEYSPGTNLCTQEMKWYHGGIQERIFRHYDDNGQLALLVEDDLNNSVGWDINGITYRRFKRIEAEANPSLPSFGKPKVVFEEILDKNSGQLIPLKKIEYAYDPNGNEISQKIYDSQGRFCYETTKSYDGRGRIIQKTNPLGHVTRFLFDDRDNLIEEELIGSGKIVRYYYDFGNRLILKQEHHNIGIVRSATYNYDVLGHLISETDFFDNKTTYQYDRFGNQIHIEKPAIHANQTSIITKKYNILNQVESETDENNAITTYEYNIYGKPTRIIYPDSTEERFNYHLTGLLSQHWYPDNTSERFEYDPNGHLVKEYQLDALGNVLRILEYGYKGPLMVYKKDSADQITLYAYDGAGRKISEQCGLKVTRYEYDDFNRIKKIKRILDDNEAQVEVYEYDWLDREISKTLQNEAGKIFSKERSTYDISGNLIKKIIDQSEDTHSIYESTYNSENKIQFLENPLGHSKTWNYDYYTANSLGQKIETRTIIDALGRKTEEIYNCRGLIRKKKIYEGDRPVSILKFYYDNKGQLKEKKAIVMTQGNKERTYSVVYNYNSLGLVESELELPNGKKTSYEYDAMQRLSSKCLHNGTKLLYDYDSLGRLTSLISTDKSIHYNYYYDISDNLIKIDDQIRQICQNRKFDQYNRLIKEEISPGLSVEYEYDLLDRIIKITLPDCSSVVFNYDAFNLKTIQRLEPNKNITYECSCNEFDFCGRLVKKTSPAGITQFKYDLLGRKVQTQSDVWEENLNKFDPIGNLIEVIQKNIIEKYSYDRFDYLTHENENTYEYDSLGNCIKKNNQSQTINSLNQILNDDKEEFSYDENGNLVKDGTSNYQYDALNRLIKYSTKEKTISFVYDAFDRCLSIDDSNELKQLIYQNENEIGCFVKDKIKELKITDPQNVETVFSIEINNEVFFPIQDHRYNICALQKNNGHLAKQYTYSAFGLKSISKEENLLNPWKFANRREIDGLILFSHRFYKPSIMRWLTPDPIGHKSGLNLYTYVYNNPFSFRDPDGQFAFVIPLFTMAFSATEVAIAFTTLKTVVAATLVAATSYVVYDISQRLDHRLNSDVLAEEEKSTEEKKKKPPYNGQELGNDPTKCPGEGFKWKGKGKPGEGKGNWVKGKRHDGQEHLNPDFDHPAPIKPHWDYEGPNFPNGARLYLDGTWEAK